MSLVKKNQDRLTNMRFSTCTYQCFLNKEGEMLSHYTKPSYAYWSDAISCKIPCMLNVCVKSFVMRMPACRNGGSTWYKCSPVSGAYCFTWFRTLGYSSANFHMTCGTYVHCINNYFILNKKLLIKATTSGKKAINPSW
jgi:hypothetical protein